MERIKYKVTGMTCSACSTRVEKCVRELEGVNEVSVNLLTESMQVLFDENKVNSDKIIDSVVEAGYGASTGNETGKTQHNSEKKDTKRLSLILSFVFLLPMMYISMNQMLFSMFNIPIPGIINDIFNGEKNAIVFSFSQFILVLPILYLNKKYYINGFKNLYHKSPNMDSLIALGSFASVLYGIFAIFRIGYGLGHSDLELVNNYRNDLYFESAGMIVTLISIGKYLESRSKKKTSEAITKLMNLSPKTATVLRGGQEVIISTSEMVVGDIVIVKPGENIPADGKIIEGYTSIDESTITGESIPVDKSKDDKVVSGTINTFGLFKFKAEKVGEDTTISQIIKLVDEASQSKAPIARMADKIAGIFVPIVMTIALICVIAWLISGANFEFALSIGIAVLVISCPCALGLATPVAIMVGTGKGAENGILIKSGEALEIAHKVDTVVLDKTGTITEGKPKVTDVIAFGLNENDFLSICYGIEKGSEHVLANAVIEYVEDKNVNMPDVSGYKSIFGMGIEAEINSNKYFAGNNALMEKEKISINSEIKDSINRLSDEGKTPLIFANEQKVIGIIGVADIEKESSKEAIELFEKMGIDVVMLTGDNERTAKAVTKKIGIKNVISQVMPKDKEMHIAKLQNLGHIVAMVGDGVNDAPALARADVGIAIGAGTDIAIDCADVVLMKNDLLDAVSTIRLSKSVIRNIKENLFWAFFYNIIGIPLAAGVLYPAFGMKLSPMFGAAAMSLSSVCVVSNALRLRYFKSSGNKSKKEKEINTMNYNLSIDGMMCEHCKKHVEDALNKISGVTEVIVNLDEKSAQVNAEREISIEEFGKIIEQAGYKLN